jgi:hypothetical protein
MGMTAEQIASEQTFSGPSNRDLAERSSLAPEISDAEVRGLAAAMDKDGFAVVKNFLRPSDLQELRGFVEGKISANSGQYVALTGKNSVAGSKLEALADDPSFQGFLRRLCATGTGRQPPAQSIYQVLRCLSGDTGVQQSMIFHYDSFVVTALVPIIIPTSGREGHLIMAPNLRRERPAYALNLLDKILVDNKITQWLLRRGHEKSWLRMKKIVMVPGDLYLFWGYRSLHANEPCDVDAIRSTALFHFGDPHLKSSLRNLMGRQKV